MTYKLLTQILLCTGFIIMAAVCFINITKAMKISYKYDGNLSSIPADVKAKKKQHHWNCFIAVILYLLAMICTFIIGYLIR